MREQEYLMQMELYVMSGTVKLEDLQAVLNLEPVISSTAQLFREYIQLGLISKPAAENLVHKLVAIEENVTSQLVEAFGHE